MTDSMPRGVLLHYHEVGLKGGNRGFFERQLIRNAERATGDLVELSFRRLSGRHLADLPDGTDLASLVDRLSRVFGCASFAFPFIVPPGQEAIAGAAIDAIAQAPGVSFAVRAKVSSHATALRSQQLQVEVGAALVAAGFGPVDLTTPDRTVRIEVVGDRALVYAERFGGPGGLPVGTAGKVVTLLSAGLDSPVAALRLMQRGARTELIHFHSQPFTDASSERAAAEIASLLARYQSKTHLALVPLAPSQQAIVAHCPEPLRTILYRRQMMRIATRLAIRSNAQALVTGDSLGQVASQTLENLAVVEEAAELPVLRPLIGMDKLEIIDQSHRHGLFEASSAPCQEACVLFEPKRPATKASIERCQEAEAGLDLAGLADQAAEEARVRRIAPTWHPIPVRTPGRAAG